MPSQSREMPRSCFQQQRIPVGWCGQACHSRVGGKEDCTADRRLNSWITYKKSTFSLHCCAWDQPGSCWHLLLFLLSDDPRNERGSVLKARQPLPPWQSTSTGSRRKVEFARVFPRRGDVSLSQPIDYNGNTIKPQEYSYPERALISLVLEDLTTADVFTTRITSVKKMFLSLLTKAQICRNTL